MTVSAPRAASVITAVSLVSLMLGLSYIGSRAWAYFNPGDTSASAPPARLHLAVSDETPLHVTLAPGESAQWLISAELTGAREGSLAMEVAADSDLVRPRGLTIEALICDEKFSQTNSSPEISCPGLSSVLVSLRPLWSLASPTGSDLFVLPSLELGAAREVLVTFTLPYDSTPRTGESATIGLGFHAAGDGPQSPGVASHPSPATLPALPRILHPRSSFPPSQHASLPIPSTQAPVPPAGPGDLAFTGLGLAALLTLGFGLLGLGTAALLRRPGHDPRRG